MNKKILVGNWLHADLRGTKNIYTYKKIYSYPHSNPSLNAKMLRSVRSTQCFFLIERHQPPLVNSNVTENIWTCLHVPCNGLFTRLWGQRTRGVPLSFYCIGGQVCKTCISTHLFVLKVSGPFLSVTNLYHENSLHRHFK